MNKFANKKILVTAERDWSYNNILPAVEKLKSENIQFVRKSMNVIDFDYNDFDLIVCCESHNVNWMKYYDTVVKGKKKVIALQQGLYWHPEANPNPSWKFDYYMIWGEQMKECCLKNGLKEEQLIITGNPQFDRIFDLKPEDDGYLLITDDFWHSIEKKYTFNLENIYNKVGKELGFNYVEVTQHPRKTKNKFPKDTVELARKCRAILSGETLAPIYGMILNKPIIIDGFRKRFDMVKSLAYKSNKFITDNSEFLKWAITGNNATEKVIKVIKENL